MKKLFYFFLLSFLGGPFPEESYAQKEKALFPETPGMAAYTYRFSFKKDVGATLDTIRSYGVTELECGINSFGMAPEELRKMLDERGMKAPSVGAGYDEIVENPEEVARKAKIMGASYVMVAWIPHEGGNFTIENAKKAAEDFNRVGKILKQHGLTFCYHNHGYEFKPYKKGTLWDYLAENTDPEYVSFTLDVLWAVHPGADPVKLLNKYGSRWKLMHLKDLKKGVKGDFSGHTPVENNVALGEGQINFPAILKAAKKAGVKHYYIEDESPVYFEQIPRSLAYLRSLKE